MTLAQALPRRIHHLLLTNSSCLRPPFGPIIHTVEHAISCGIPLIAAVTISVWKARWAWRPHCLRLMVTASAAKRVLVLGLLAQAFGALGYVFVRELARFYTVSGAVRLHLCGTMPLYARSPAENLPLPK